jgi:hypothetical protein
MQSKISGLRGEAMPEQSFPALPEVLDDACTWVSIIVRSLAPGRPALARAAAQHSRGMVESAIATTPDGQSLAIRVDLVDQGLRVEVAHPGRGAGGGDAWGRLSAVVAEFGTRVTGDEHTAWILLRHDTTEARR